MDAVLHRVSSPTFVGRADELAALDGALGRAAAGVPAFTFVAGESGVGKSRLVAELEIPRAARRARACFVGHCLELGGAAIPYAPLVDALRPIARELAECGSEIADALPPATRAALAELMPEFGDAGARSADGERPPGARVRGAAGADRAARPRPAGRARARGPALGRPLDARLPHLPRAQRAHGAALARRDLPLRRAAPPPPAPAAAGRARAHAGRGPARARALQPRRGARAGLRDPRRAGAATISPTACSSAARATRSTPRSCSPPPRTAARSCRTRCATCCSPASSGCRRPRRRSCGSISVEHPMRHALLAALSRPRRAGAAARAARGGRQPGARDRRRARRTRSGTRSSARPSTATCSRASAARCTRGSPSAVDARHELMGDAPAAAVAAMLACHWNAAHDVPRALGSSVARRAGRQARARVQRGRSATSSARWSCGTACPTPRSAPGCDRVDAAAPRRRRRPPRRRSGRARSRSRARRSPQVDADADPLRAAFLLERLGNYLRWAGETEESFAALRPRDGAAARRARAPQRARLLEHRARGLMLRGQLRGGRRGRRRGAGDGRALGDRDDRGPRAQHARPLARRARRRSTRASRCCGARATSPPARPAGRARAGDHEPQRGAGPRGPHRGGAGRGRGRAWPRCGRTPSGPPTTRSGAAGRQLHDPARPARRARARAARRPKFGDAAGTTPIFLSELRARVALLTGDAAPRRAAELEELRRLCLGHAGPAVDGAAARDGGAGRAARGTPRGRARRDPPRAGLAGAHARTARGSCGWRGSA